MPLTPNPKTAATWTIDDAATLYGVRQWGGGYFDLAANGDVTVKATFADGTTTAVSLMEIVAGIEQRGHAMPVLLRVENLLDARIALLNETFRQAIADSGYRGDYRGVFPVKVNQQAQVIEEIVRFGAPYQHGLEAGSKAELLLAIASLGGGGLLICNGYKDREFIDLGLHARKLGIDCCFVIESPGELATILERSRLLAVRPMIGVRVKVSSRVGGLWTETSGDRSSFGLNTAQLLEVVDTLRRHELLDTLQLLHCHLGSQIPALADIRAGVEEACRYYAALAAEGAALGYIDFGGGLAVDYLGSRAEHVHSRAYELADYCRTIVATVQGALDPLHLPHPHIVTESGRATVAYASLLIFNILDIMHFEAVDLPAQLPADAHQATRTLFRLHEECAVNDDPQGCYSAALANRDQLRDDFRRGTVGLRERSLGENLFLAIAQGVAARFNHPDVELPPGLNGLRESLADIYYGNFSVFQSLPDTWAIGQIFPLVPLHRHTEAPVRDGIISDLTCDCDGKLDTFVVAGRERPTLPLHPLRAGEEYLLGVFLMGAYQETLGDLHNLFGDTHVVSVRLNREGGFDVMREIAGDSIADVLSYVEYQPQALFEHFRTKAEAAVRSGRITVPERQRILDDFSARLQGYTYFKA